VLLFGNKELVEFSVELLNTSKLIVLEVAAVELSKSPVICIELLSEFVISVEEYE
jgi:hypothetical protein